MGEKKDLRFGEKADDMHIRPKHFIKLKTFAGSINCMAGVVDGKTRECLLCKNASSGWDDPISKAVDYFVTIVLDRSDGRAKFYEGGYYVRNKLMEFYKVNGDIRLIDFQLFRQKQKGAGTWSMTPLINTTRPLNDEEKDEIAKLDIKQALKMGFKSIAEIEEIINSLKCQH
ncbi:hypothetical protein ACFL52_00965 [Candidatus Margulisiibacteriota bacterium]